MIHKLLLKIKNNRIVVFISIFFILIAFAIKFVFDDKTKTEQSSNVVLRPTRSSIYTIMEQANKTPTATIISTALNIIKETKATHDVINTKDITTSKLTSKPTTKHTANVTVTSTLMPTPIPTPTQVLYYTKKDIIALAKVLYNECRGVSSDMEKACVAWVACNRVDAGYGQTIYNVVTAPHQFAYVGDTPVIDELYYLALDVLERWNDEKNGKTNVGRVLPYNYLYFGGDGKHNYFRNAYSGNYDIWDYSLDNPYED